MALPWRWPASRCSCVARFRSREGTSIYQLPLAAVVLSAWYGGRGPGLLASLICMMGAAYWLVPPVDSFQVSPEHVLPFSIFIALCLLLTEFGASRRRVERALEESERRFRLMAETDPGDRSGPSPSRPGKCCT